MILNITLDPTVLELLRTPISWLVYEIFAFILIITVIYDIIKRYDGNTRFIRLMEICGFVLYAVIFENLGVASTTYNYSSHRLMMVGVVPLSIPLFEAAIFYCSALFAESLRFKKWIRPFIISFFGMLQDFTLDPVAVSDTYVFDNSLQGRWIWDPSIHYQNMFYGIPYFNFAGWFVLMFYYAVLIQIGRRYYEKKGEKISVGLLYIFFAVILSDLLLVSPLSLFLLYAYPFSTVFGNRTAEIIMLSIIATSVISIVIYQITLQKREKTLEFRKYCIIWIVVGVMHLLDLVIAVIQGFWSILVPVFIFGGIHILYLTYYFNLGHTQT
ncbi:MAG: carotenoid biosynthesis protein [Candidatus Lokiarchaeota archaeon]|nr:carotenoid biosynthesis protein [Candidatus Harpocratesius repetitus]